MLAEDGSNAGDEVDVLELHVVAATGPDAVGAGFVHGLVPEGELFEGCLFEVGRERDLAGAWGGAGEDVAAGVGQPGG